MVYIHEFKVDTKIKIKNRVIIIYIVYGAIIIISNIVNGTLEQIVIVNVLLNTIIFPFFIIQHGKGNLYSALKAFVFSFIVQIIINDFLMIVFGNVFTGDGIKQLLFG